MAKLIQLRTLTDERGSLTVVEKVTGFDIKRVYYIYDVNDSPRGGHRHKITIQAAICISGSCTIFTDNGVDKQTFHLSKPNECLILETQDWHTMSDFSENCILMVLASEYFDAGDYIYEPYESN